MKYYLLFLLLGTFCRSNAQRDSILKWTPDRRLTYNDFLGQRPTPEMSHDDFDTLAVIDCSINYNIGIKNGKLIIHAYAFVNPHKSWMDEKNVFVLKHEQGHFDIAEIFARRFEEIVTDTSIADPGTYITFVNKTVEQIFSLLTEEDKKYDFYTMNRLGREYYDNWINDQLNGHAK